MNDHKVELVVSSVFRSIKSPNDKRTLYIECNSTKSKGTIDEIFDQLNKKHESLTKLLKNIDF